MKIAASILSADFSRLGEQVWESLQAGADWIHVDVMDGHFVPNITIGPVVVKALRPLADEFRVALDVHLMIEQPDHYLADFAEAGANHLTVHVEIVVDGGINQENAADAVQAGAIVLVAGSAIFGPQASIAENVRSLRAAARGDG